MTGNATWCGRRSMPGSRSSGRAGACIGGRHPRGGPRRPQPARSGIRARPGHLHGRRPGWDTRSSTAAPPGTRRRSTTTPSSSRRRAPGAGRQRPASTCRRSRSPRRGCVLGQRNTSELDLDEVAADAAVSPRAGWSRAGLCPDEAALAAYAESLRDLHRDPRGAPDLAWRNRDHAEVRAGRRAPARDQEFPRSPGAAAQPPHLKTSRRPHALQEARYHLGPEMLGLVGQGIGGGEHPAGGGAGLPGGLRHGADGGVSEPVPAAARSMARMISCVAAPCSSTAAATAEATPSIPGCACRSPRSPARHRRWRPGCGRSGR